MKAKYFLILSAIALLIFGLGFVLAPTWTMALFDLTLEPGGVVMTQLLGAAFLGLALLNWTSRNIAVLEDARHIFVGNFAMDAIGFVVVLVHYLGGVGNSLTWVPIILYLLFALAFGYCLLDKRTIEEVQVTTKHA